MLSLIQTGKVSWKIDGEYIIYTLFERSVSIPFEFTSEDNNTLNEQNAIIPSKVTITKAKDEEVILTKAKDEEVTITKAKDFSTD